MRFLFRFIQLFLISLQTNYIRERLEITCYLLL